eukprot:Em0021g601a
MLSITDQQPYEEESDETEKYDALIGNFASLTIDKKKQFALVPKKPSQSDSTSIQDPDQRYLDYMKYPSGSHYSTWKKQNPTTGYTLQDLFLTQFPNCSEFILKVIGNLNKVKQKSSALCHFFLKHISPADQEYCTYEEEFSCFQHLPSFVTSNRFIADCYLCMSVDTNRKDKAEFAPFSCGRSSCNVCSNVNLKEGYFEKLNEENALPVVPIEIDSGKIWESVHKCGIAVLENLRLVRCFGLEVNEWSGFTFPNSTRKEAVIQVTVKTTSERPFFFSVATEFLTMDSVKNAVVTVYRKQKQILSTVQDSQLDSAFVYKLSESELASLAANFMTSIGSNKGFRCAQIPSITSLMLYCYNEEAAYFLKHLIGAKQRDNLQRIEAFFRDCKSDHPVLLSYKACVLKKSYFHCFVAKPKPLNTLEAGCCLKQFVHLVSTSLQRLHEDYHLAHTDVRTDNICFIDDGSRAIFIDIDRCSETDNIVDEKWCTKKSALYHSEFTNEKIDWRQLGCTIYWILKCTSLKTCDSIHELDVTGRPT